MLERVFPHKLLADISRQHTLAYASQDLVVLNAVLCTTAGALYAHSGDAMHGYHFMYFKGQAIHHLNRQLSKFDDCRLHVSTLYAVCLLLWVEVSFGQLDFQTFWADRDINIVFGG